MNLALSESKVHAVQDALSWLCAQTEANTCIVCDLAGNVMAQEGNGPWESSLVTALAAGVYGASRELARVLGQEEFDSVLNQGEKTSIFFQSVVGDVLLVSVYSEAASTGLVKLYAARTAGIIRRVLAREERQGDVGDTRTPLVIEGDHDMFGVNVKQAEQNAVPEPVSIA